MKKMLIVHQKTQTTYDMNGNCTSIRHYKNASEFSETKTVYNSEDQPFIILNALGNETKIIYHHSDHLEKETIDPLGRKQIEMYDQINRLFAVHKLSASHDHLACTAFAYDGRGNKIIQKERNYFQGQECGDYLITTSYDCMGQKTSETEQNDKKTSYSYHNSKLDQITKPDGVILTHRYDSLGRLSELVSSDGTIHYRYTYDLNDNILKVEDHIQQTSTERRYDNHDRLSFEKQATGLEVNYTYDMVDRLTSIEFQEQKITYAYSPTAFTSSSRYKKRSTCL